MRTLLLVTVGVIVGAIVMPGVAALAAFELMRRSEASR